MALSQVSSFHGAMALAPFRPVSSHWWLVAAAPRHRSPPPPTRAPRTARDRATAHQDRRQGGCGTRPARTRAAKVLAGAGRAPLGRGRVDRQAPPRQTWSRPGGRNARRAMRAIVYHGPGDKRWEEVPDPKLIDDTDAVVRVDTVTICGTDLHILKGDVPEVTPGRVLGHEAVGTVLETGPSVRTLREGDRVLLSCISACGRCRFCRAGQYGQCLGGGGGGGGWIFGHLIDGVQAEYARMPFADTSTYKVPRGSATSRCCTWPTSWRPGMRSACSTGGSSPATRWRWWVPARSGWPRSSARGCSPRPRSWRSTRPSRGGTGRARSARPPWPPPRRPAAWWRG